MSSEKKEDKGKYFWEFFSMNKGAIITSVVITVLMIGLYFWNASILEAFSLIVAFPAFILSFFVIKAVTISRESLEAYHKRKMISESIHRQNLVTVKKIFDDELSEVCQLYRNNYLIFIRNKRNGTAVNLQMINTCKKEFNKIRDFYINTYDYVKDKLNETNVNIGELNNYADKYDGLNSNDFEVMKDFFLNKITPNDYFVEEDPNMDSKLQELEKVFGDQRNLFGNYLQICKYLDSCFEEGTV